MTIDEYDCCRNAYISLLKLPNGELRMEFQYILCSLRRVLAQKLRGSEEDIQSYFEEIAYDRYC